MTADKLTKPTDEVRALLERAAHYSESTITDETTKRYAGEFRQFAKWAEARGLPAMPSEVPVVACYLAALADGAVETVYVSTAGKSYVRKRPYKYASIAHAYTAILHAHRAAGHDWPHAIPAIAKVMRGIAHRHGTRKRKMTPLLIEDLRKVLLSLRERRYEDLTVIRDKALLSLCFFSAMRRGELVALVVSDLTFVEDKGLIVLIRKSKTDQVGAGREVGITPQKDPAICPIVLLKDWLAKSETKAGPIFRRIDRNGCVGNRPLGGDSIADLVKQHVERIGLDPENFGGHSLRAGFATSAAQAGKSLHNIMRQTGHKDERVAMSYIRHGTVLDDNATEGLGDEEGDDG